ncbi:MAG: T9SS type A sorting domain-containing protein, partial [bacterium]
TAQETTLLVYDLSGRLVSSVLNESKGALRPSPSRIIWDGSDAGGRELPSGVYFLRLKKGDTSLVKKVVILR